MNKYTPILAIALIAIGFMLIISAFGSSLPFINRDTNKTDNYQPLPLPKNETGSLAGDFDGDGVLSEADRTALTNHYNEHDAAYDLNNDGIVDIYDITRWEYLRYLSEGPMNQGGSSSSDSGHGGGGGRGTTPLSILPFNGDLILGVILLVIGVILLVWRH